MALGRSAKIRRKWRSMLILAQDGCCAACGELMAIHGDPLSPEYATLDHIKPKSRGGPSGRSNLLLKHRRCNEERADRPPTKRDLLMLANVNAFLEAYVEAAVPVRRVGS